MILKNLKNLIPYLVLIVIYFIFVNIEAKKEINKLNEKKYNVQKEAQLNSNKEFKLKIPVIPYEKWEILF